MDSNITIGHIINTGECLRKWFGNRLLVYHFKINGVKMKG